MQWASSGPTPIGRRWSRRADPSTICRIGSRLCGDGSKSSSSGPARRLGGRTYTSTEATSSGRRSTQGWWKRSRSPSARSCSVQDIPCSRAWSTGMCSRCGVSGRSPADWCSLRIPWSEDRHVSVGSASDLEGICAAGAAASRVLDLMLKAVEPGVTPMELNDLGAVEMWGLGARSAPMLSVGFPAETCISVNHAIAHGIPAEEPLTDGDLVNIDVSLELDGFFADTGASMPVVPGHATLDHLCATGRRAL